MKEIVETLVREKFEVRGYVVICVWNAYQGRFLIGHFDKSNKKMTRIAFDVMNEVIREYPQAFVNGTIEGYNEMRTPIVFCMTTLVERTLRECKYDFTKTI